MNGLAAEGVTVRLGGREVVSGASVAVAPGRIVALIGPNGAGKSSLLGALSGERAPSTGRATLDGVGLSTIPAAALARRRAVLAQATDLAFAFTVDEVARLGLPPGVSKREADALVASALGEVDLAGAGARICTALSGGERQRAHLARVLVQLAAAPDGRPRYLLLDEPTAGLDLAHQLATLEIARRHAAGGGGVLAVLHDLNLAAMAADEIVALKEGRVVARGTPAETLTDALMREIYDVDARIGEAPAGPFLLPQTARPIDPGA